ncbi:MAG: dTDP-4-dehydrorhamnose 3,5-epimerase [Calditrichaeota bacterium]|nr:MAG: dTDP-4-dehydrorhamnose 3,5-epimerase [Calditrichota bacterium]
MKIIKHLFDDVLVIEPKIFDDNRGFFFESYHDTKMANLGISVRFVQDNHSYSKFKNTIRGMHFQSDNFAQSKLVRVIKGEIENFVVDIRRSSKSFLKYDSYILSAENKYMLYIPRGFANGFKTLTDGCEVLYKVDNYYSPKFDHAFRFDDPEIGIQWNVNNPILSDRDRNAPYFADIKGSNIFK